MSFADVRKAALETWEAEERSDRPAIFIGTATCGLAAGAGDLLDAVDHELAEARVRADVRQVGCIGLCYAEPLVDVRLPGGPRVCYHDVTPKKLAAIVRRHVKGGEPIAKWALGTLGSGEIPGIPSLWDLPMLRPQVRVALRNCGIIDPDRLDHYVARGGYAGLERALSMKPEEVIEEVKRSGLRGRGGAGFPTGRKWEMCRANESDQRYLICNGSEGDPGAFMDRSVIEGDPHAVLEGMCIAAYAIGASEGYVYCCAEYALAVRRLRHTIAEMEKAGLLGDRILGTDFSFRLHVKEGAGAYVCGEETALIASIEGRRGMPAPRPPFPAVRGLFGKPSNINNVETFAYVPTILRDGAAGFARFGTESSKGTKTFALTGKVSRTGLIEVPMGITLREVIFGIGGGIPDGGRFKAAQTGGPSGGCIPAQFLDLPIDYERLAEIGSMMGSGGLVVLDEASCMVDLARYFLTFTQNESCGKCVPCRLGTKQMLMILEDIASGRADERAIPLLESLGDAVKKGSLCGLGQTAPNPVLTTIRYFRDEYLDHVREQRCEAGVCGDLFWAACSNRCPAEVDVPAYVSLAAEGRWAEALATHLDRNPFPSVCARICPRPCEAACRRTTLDGQPVAIRAIERVMADRSTDARPTVLERPASERRCVAVVGAGPAGLTAAFFLRRLGHHVTVYEAMPKPGGMLRYGIPEYRLPRAALDRDIRRIEKLGVRIECNSPLDGKRTLERLRKDHDAVFLAVGAWSDVPLGIAGEDTGGVLSGIDFLRRVAEGRQGRLEGDVVVLGGRNSTIDAARTALRLGASSATIAYRRTRGEMPAQREEIEEAEEEGVRFEFLLAPESLVFGGRPRRLRALRLQRMQLGDFDDSGRRRPVPIEGDFVELPARWVIRALGRRPAPVPGGPQTGVDRTMRTDRWTLATDIQGVFAGGDMVLGPATAVEAIGHGRRAAEAIERFLFPDVTPLYPWRRKRDLDTLFDPGAPASKTKRSPARKLAVPSRIRGFAEVARPLSTPDCRREALRCLRCDYGKTVVDRFAAAADVGDRSGEGRRPTTSTSTSKARRFCGGEVGQPCSN